MSALEELAEVVPCFEVSRVLDWFHINVFTSGPVAKKHPDAVVGGYRVNFGCPEGCTIRKFVDPHVAFGATAEAAAQHALRMLRTPLTYSLCLCDMPQTNLDYMIGKQPRPEAWDGPWVFCRLCGAEIGPAQ